MKTKPVRNQSTNVSIPVCVKSDHPATPHSSFLSCRPNPINPIHKDHGTIPLYPLDKLAAISTSELPGPRLTGELERSVEVGVTVRHLRIRARDGVQGSVLFGVRFTSSFQHGWAALDPQACFTGHILLSCRLALYGVLAMPALSALQVTCCWCGDIV